MKTNFTRTISSLLCGVLCLFAVSLTAQNGGDGVRIVITSPVELEGTYVSAQALFGPASTTISGDIVLIDDGIDTTGTITDGCNPIMNDISGKIALIDRGACAFVTKVLNAQDGGAIAVVVCNNNVDAPDEIIALGGDDGGAATIPAVMISFNNCEALKMNMPVAGGMVVDVGEHCGNEIVVSEGTHTTPAFVGFTGGVIDANAPSPGALWYSYTPATNGVVTVDACDGGADTRLAIVNGDCAAPNIIVVNDDFCADGASGYDYASSASTVVAAGNEYKIHWDERWSSGSFDFNIALDPNLPMVTLSITADVSFETVDPAGMFLAFAVPGQPLSAVAMNDNGNGTWSFDLSVTALDSIYYTFVNGDFADVTNAEVIPGECAVTTDLGVAARLHVAGGMDESIQNCFSACTASCTPVDCGAPAPLDEENFEGYTVGDVASDVDATIAPWPGGTGVSAISDEQPNADGTANLSIKVDGTSGTEDILWLLGDRTEGHFVVAFNMYIPAGNGAYYNFQKLEATGEWAFQPTFNGDGTGTMDVGGEPVPFTYPEDTWFQCIHVIDLNNNFITAHIEGNRVAAWPFNWQATATDGILQLGAVNFFPLDANQLYYVDNLIYWQVPDAVEGFYCQTASDAVEGTNTTAVLDCFGGPNAQGLSGHWFQWTAPADGYISVGSCGDPADTRLWMYEGGCSGPMLGATDDRCISEGDNPYAGYREAMVTSGMTYTIVWDSRWTTDSFDWDLTFTEGAPADGDHCGTAIPVDFGNHTVDALNGAASISGKVAGIVQNSTEIFYTQSEWYSYTPTEDTEVRIYSCDLAATNTRVWVYTGACGNFTSLDNFANGYNECGDQSDVTFNATAGTTYYIEWDGSIYAGAGEPVLDGFEWAIEQILPVVDVTFQVDMNMEDPAVTQALIAGEFNGWGDTNMADANMDGIWSYTTQLTVGDTVEYKFKTDPDGWETPPVECTLGGFGNRFIVVGESSEIIDVICFNSCTADCSDIVAVQDAELSAAVNMYPNPATNQTNLVYDFAEATDVVVRMSNNLGQIVYERSLFGATTGSLQIELSNLATGMYFVQLTDGERQYSEKLFVK